MTAKSVLIIGAGLAGLSAGCYAQMNGYPSHIFEHHTVPGGVAAAWKRKGYLIDGGIHFLMGHKPGTALHQLYRELGIAGHCPVVDMTTYGRFTDEVAGRSVTVTADLDRLPRDLKAFSPDDGNVVDELMAGARAMQGFDLSQVGMGRPPELMGPLAQFREYWDMRHLLKFYVGKYARPVAEYARQAHDPWLRQVMEHLFLPEVPVWFIFMVLALLADGQVGLLPGGCLDFVLPMERRYKDLGGQVTYGATVERILVEGDRAVGVRLADGTEHRGDAVISAADGYSTIFQMLGGRYADQKTRRRYREWPLIRPLLMASFGVAREFPGEPWLQIIRLADPLRIGDHECPALMVRIFNYGDRFAPPGRTVVQASIETEWDFWETLREDRARYDAEKARVAEEILARLEAHYPGLSAQVEMTDVATPYTTWRYTRNHRGAYMGWLPTPEVLTTTIPRTLPGLRGFCMAGQWVMPGGGVPPCLYSGQHAVQILCHQDGRPFVHGP